MRFGLLYTTAEAYFESTLLCPEPKLPWELLIVYRAIDQSFRPKRLNEIGLRWQTLTALAYLGVQYCDIFIRSVQSEKKLNDTWLWVKRSFTDATNKVVQWYSCLYCSFSGPVQELLEMSPYIAFMDIACMTWALEFLWKGKITHGTFTREYSVFYLYWCPLGHAMRFTSYVISVSRRLLDHSIYAVIQGPRKQIIHWLKQFESMDIQRALHTLSSLFRTLWGLVFH